MKVATRSRPLIASTREHLLTIKPDAQLLAGAQFLPAAQLPGEGAWDRHRLLSEQFRNAGFNASPIKAFVEGARGSL